jgi:hypothetical protein
MISRYRASTSGRLASWNRSHCLPELADVLFDAVNTEIPETPHILPSGAYRAVLVIALLERLKAHGDTWSSLKQDPKGSVLGVIDKVIQHRGWTELEAILHHILNIRYAPTSKVKVENTVAFTDPSWLIRHAGYLHPEARSSLASHTQLYARHRHESPQKSHPLDSAPIILRSTLTHDSDSRDD